LKTDSNLFCARASRGLRLAAAALITLAPLHAVPAATIVTGSVVSSTSGAPVVGATVSVRRGNSTLGTDASKADGKFRVVFDVGVDSAAQQLKLFAEHPDYAPVTNDVTVTSGRVQPASVTFRLLPNSVKDCLRSQSHSIVVGYFRPPADYPTQGDFAGRIVENLSYDLLPQLQQLNAFRANPALQPTARECQAARPQSPSEYGNFAKALNADAFLGGYVVPAGELFKVEMSVADRFGQLAQPVRASSPNVNLNDPAATHLSPAAHETLLAILAIGYEKDRRYAECVEVTVAAERILGGLPQSLAATRQRCRAALGNNGLLGEAGP